MKTAELRAKYLAFFESKGHSVHPSGSLVPFDVTGRLDESLLFNGAGMVQFKPYFRGVAAPPNPRLTTAQKCVRTGDIDEVGDASHLTFFEMLGNFSFGNYFKEEAIAFSWEFLTSKEWLGLDAARLTFTVFTEDDEAHGFWSRWIQDAGLDPTHRVFRLGEDTNYWPAKAFSSGPPGPCGPNSEMFYWVPNDEPAPSGPYSVEDWLRDEAAGKWLEIWNDVFIQYEWQGRLKNPDRPADGYEKEGMPELPFRSIDTGMGLERTAAVLGGFRSVYDTDAFQAILRRVEGLRPGLRYGTDPETDRAMRIIADHIRTACFCLADGILPANNGRGYVLRRLIRRAVLKGLRVLGFDKPFFHEIYEGVVSTMGHHYHELVERGDAIVQTLRSEEELFRRTISSGEELLTNWLESLRAEGKPVLSGVDAFRLYDTYGFPLEVTQELCAEAGVEVDLDGYEVAMAEAQERSRGAGGMDTVYGGEGVHFALVFVEENTSGTMFMGYGATEWESRVVGAVPEVDETGATTGRIALALEETPFYAESGGQVSDEGRISGPGFEFQVVDLIKQDGVFVHLVQPMEMAHPEGLAGKTPERIQEILTAQVFYQVVKATVDAPRRANITRNHTATHLLHAALRRTLGKHVTQQGSLVSPEHLRFDFSHGKAMTREELDAVEQWVNAQILAGHDVHMRADVAIDDARAMGAMALFGEKYGDRVRVVEIRDDSGAPVSIELCGGIHVANTGKVGAFKILHESSAASGVRRIEAITGPRTLAWMEEQNQTVRRAAALLKSSESEVLRAIERTLEQLKEERRKLERLLSQSASANDAEVLSIGPVSLVVREVEGLEAKEAQGIVDHLVNNDTKKIAVVVVKADGKVTFIAKAGKDAPGLGVHCGNLVKALAAATGGGGGGRPDFATAGGRDLSKLADAVRSIPDLIKDQVS